MVLQQGESQRCKRCGTCCSKGGPGLHDEDIHLVLEKIITPENLYTIRIGELVRDNVNGGLMYTGSEIIKTRSSPDSHACVFFRKQENVCGIYQDRPAECRALECWNSGVVHQMHVQNRLDRKALFGSIGWLWEMIQTHEEKCGFLSVKRLLEARREGDPVASISLGEAISHDQAIRDIVVEKAGLDTGMLDLVFGLSLKVVLQRRFGVKVEKRDGGSGIVFQR